MEFYSFSIFLFYFLLLNEFCSTFFNVSFDLSVINTVQ